MMDESGRVVYHLIFVTKFWMGMDLMKKAMLKVVGNGTYTFTDKTTLNQTYFFSDKSDWIPDYASSIFNRFCGQEVKNEAIRDYVLAKTPYRLWKSALIHLEKSNPPLISSVTKRKTKAISYPEDCSIKFAPK